MKTVFNYKEYSNILQGDIEKHQLKEPRFVSISYYEEVLIIHKNVLYTPTLKTSKVEYVIPKVVRTLATESDFVIFTMERVIGTDRKLIANFDHQPRDSSYIWLVADVAFPKISWYKEYGSSSDIQDFISAFNIISVDTISQEKEITNLGIDIYKDLYRAALGFNFLQAKGFEYLLELNSPRTDAPFYTYNVRRLLEEGI